MRESPQGRPFQRLELYEAKVSRTVLRGEEAGNGFLLPDFKMTMGTTFNINSPSTYYKHLLLAQFHEFMTKENFNSVRHAITCSVLAYHLREWIWKCNSAEVRNYLLSEKFIKKSKIRRDDHVVCKFNEYINKECPEFKMIHEICNGSKHFYPGENDKIEDTYTREGGFTGSSFCGESFQTNDLMIKDACGKEFIFKKIIEKVVTYYGELLSKLKI